jgi:hypothetical protein
LAYAFSTMKKSFWFKGQMASPSYEKSFSLDSEDSLIGVFSCSGSICTP